MGQCVFLPNAKVQGKVVQDTDWEVLAHRRVKYFLLHAGTCLHYLKARTNKYTDVEKD